MEGFSIKFALKLLSIYLVIVAMVMDFAGVDGQEVAAAGRQRRARNRGDRAQMIRQFLKKKGRLEGLVRLVDGTVPHEGNVEVFHLGKWGSVCDDEWDIREATVICRELGWDDVARPTHNSMYGPARNPFWIDNTYCTGGEKNLTECRFDGWGQNDCHESEAAGVICQTGPGLRRIIEEDGESDRQVTSSTTTEAAPVLAKKLQSDMVPRIRIQEVMGSDAKVRIQGGRVAEEGRVEIQRTDGSWGLVCGDGWSLFEAMVVCRQLGLGYAQHAVQTDFFGGNRSELALSGVNCRGGESSLAQCFHDRYGEIDCPGRGENIAAVVCVPEMADLVPDHYEIMRSAHLEDRQMFFLQCAMEENCLAASAYQQKLDDPYNWHLTTRRLLRFTARIANLGTADFKPLVPKHKWEWHACHMHYHSMEVFAHFDIISSTGVKIAEGHKASFCLEDNQCGNDAEPVYKCANYGDQGISVNCTDTYAYNIDCQWIDITDIDPGVYTFKVVINPEMKVAEQTYDNNAVVCALYYTEQYARLFNCTLQRP